MKTLQSSALFLTSILTSMAYAGGPDLPPPPPLFYLSIEAGGGSATVGDLDGSVGPLGSAFAFTIPTPTVLSQKIHHGVFQGGASLGMKAASNPLRFALQYLWTGTARYTASPILSTAPDLANDSFDSKITSNALFLNAFLDGFICPQWSVFVGAGVGASWNHSQSNYTVQTALPSTIGTFSSSQERTYFAAQGTAGLSFHMSRNWFLNAFYRFTYFNKVDLGSFTPSTITITQASLFAKSYYTNTGELELGYYFA